MNNSKTRGLICFLAATALLLCVSSVVCADWNPGDPYKMHYPQLPDVTQTGIDVLATRQGPWVTTNPLWKILADDFMCTESGPINDIHIWGSWLNNQVPPPPSVQFKLSIHSDDVSGPFSKPGPELWHFVMTPTAARIWPFGTGVTEEFYDPNIGQFVGGDNEVWQYNFLIPATAPHFYQEAGTVYWLDVQALTPTGTYFGWKTTNPTITPHFRDDAVFGDTVDFGGPLIAPGWRPLVYPFGPYAGLSMDLAFVITPEPGSLTILAIGAMGLLARRRN